MLPIAQQYTHNLIYSFSYISIYCSIQVTHLRDFEYWKIFSGLTIEEIREREKCYEYPPRLQIHCKQIDFSKSLSSSFVVSKRNRDKEISITQFSLVKQVSGNYIHT